MASKSSSPIRIIDRGAGIAGYPDFNQNSFLQDGSWHDLDLSAIVPANAKLAIVSVTIINATAGKTISFRSKNGTNYNYCSLVAQVAVQRIGNQFIIPLSGGKIQFNADMTVWAEINLTVMGWFV
jgi:hypothetical protein